MKNFVAKKKRKRENSPESELFFPSLLFCFVLFCSLRHVFADPSKMKRLSLVSTKGFKGPWSLPRRNSCDNADPRSYKFDSRGFTALVNVNTFEPNEISVKTLDHMIIVECKHESKSASQRGSVERHFVRKFSLPSEYDMKSVQSTLTKDGFLTLQAPRPHIQGDEQHSGDTSPTEKPSFLMSLLSNRAHSLLKRSHSMPSDNEDE